MEQYPSLGFETSPAAPSASYGSTIPATTHEELRHEDPRMATRRRRAMKEHEKADDALISFDLEFTKARAQPEQPRRLRHRPHLARRRQPMALLGRAGQSHDQAPPPAGRIQEVSRLPQGRHS